MPSSGERKCPHAAKGEIIKDFNRPDETSGCKWNINPHTSRPFGERPKILPNILEVIGHTPLIHLNKIPKAEGIKCDMYAKCEFLNPGGSVKDRIGYRMVRDAIEKGVLKPGFTVIEPTSGNTGIGLAMACAVYGFRCIIVMPDKMSNEKVAALHVLGAEIIRTPIEAAFDSPDGLIAVAQRLEKEIPNSIILDQYKNPGNPLAHYDGTGSEILWQCENDVDMVVIGAGTGGTVTGIGRKVKEVAPNCTIVAVDPFGSILAQPEALNKTDVNYYEVEGIGYDFIPTVLDRSVVDKWIKVGDKECFTMARRLNLEEGILCGGSSGAALSAALLAAKDLKEGQKCVVILPDSIRNYMTKFVTDNWMEARGFSDPVNKFSASWWDKKVTELNLTPPQTFSENTTFETAYNFMKKNNVDQIPIIRSEDGYIMGAVTLLSLTNQMVSNNMHASDLICKAIYKKYIKVDKSTSLGKIGRILETETFVFVVEPQSDSKKLSIKGVVTQKDLLDYILQETTSNNTTNGTSKK